jgi:hypothetical protein
LYDPPNFLTDLFQSVINLKRPKTSERRRLPHLTTELPETVPYDDGWRGYDEPVFDF